MDIATTRDIVIIVLFSILTILIIGGSIAAFIIYRKVSKSIKDTKAKIMSPIIKVQRILAYVRGGAKGLSESLDILRGREVKHEHQTTSRH